MDTTLPYVDTLFKDYLMFRGFTATLQAFNSELASDRCCGFQAEALCELIFGQLLPQCRTTQLMELLELLSERLYSQLDGRFEGLIERMEVALVKAALVTCVRAGKQDKVAEFFKQHGDLLLSGPEAGVWRQWAALAFVPTPRKDPAFQAYFSPEWMSLLEISFRNFLSQVTAALPLPAVLRFNEDRRHRKALQQQVDFLQRQVESLSCRLTEAQSAAQSAAVVALSQQQQRQQRPEEQQQPHPPPQARAQALTTITQQQQQQQQGDLQAQPPTTGTGDRRVDGGSGEGRVGGAGPPLRARHPESVPGRLRVPLGTDADSGGSGGGSNAPVARPPTAVAAAAVPPPSAESAAGAAFDTTVTANGILVTGLQPPPAQQQAPLPGHQHPQRPEPCPLTAMQPGPGQPGSPPALHGAAGGSGHPPHPHPHPQSHHGRTLSLEAWHSITAEEAQAADSGTSPSSRSPGALPSATQPPANHQPGSSSSSSSSSSTRSNTSVSDAAAPPTAGGVAGDEQSNGSSTAALTGPTAAVPLRAVRGGSGGQAGGSPERPPSLPRVAEEGGEARPALEDGLTAVEPFGTMPLAPVPLMSLSPVPLSSPSLLQLFLRESLMGAAAAGAATEAAAVSERAAEADAAGPAGAVWGGGVVGRGPLSPTSAPADEEADPEEEEDPAVMLVAGSLDNTTPGGRSWRGAVRGIAGATDAGGTLATSGTNPQGTEGDGERGAEEEDVEGTEGEGGEGDGGNEADAATIDSLGSKTSSSVQYGSGRPVGPAVATVASLHRGSGAATSGGVVGVGRWQGTGTYGAGPGVLHRRGAAVLAARFSPGGGHNAATGAADGSVAIWSPSSLAASGGGTGAGVGSSSAGQHSSSAREARLACGAPVTCVAWDARADKVMLVGTAGRGILAWHADTRRVASEIPPDPTVPWVCQLACSPKDPVFIVAAASGPPTALAAVAASASASGSSSSSSSGAIQQQHQQQPGRAGGAGSGRGGGGGGSGAWVMTPQRVLTSTGHHHHQHHHSQGPGQKAVDTGPAGAPGGSSGRLSLWNMRAFKRVSNYNVPQDSPVLSLAFNAQGSWFAAGTACGAVHLYDSSSSGSRPQPLSSFRANVAPLLGSNASATYAPAVVQVYDSGSETVLVTCCGATVRLWSLRRLAEPLLSVPLLTYLPYGSASCGGWSADWAPAMALSPRGGAAAVVLGGGGPAVYVVDLQGGQGDDSAGGGGNSGWLSGVFGSPTSASLPGPAAAAALSAVAAASTAGRVSVVLPYSGDGGGGGGSGALTPHGAAGPVLWRSSSASATMGRAPYDSYGALEDDELVYGTSCSWHPSRDVLVVGYSDGGAQAVGLARGAG